MPNLATLITLALLPSSHYYDTRRGKGSLWPDHFPFCGTVELNGSIWSHWFLPPFSLTFFPFSSPRDGARVRSVWPNWSILQWENASEEPNQAALPSLMPRNFFLLLSHKRGDELEASVYYPSYKSKSRVLSPSLSSLWRKKSFD